MRSLTSEADHDLQRIAAYAVSQHRAYEKHIVDYCQSLIDDAEACKASLERFLAHPNWVKGTRALGLDCPYDSVPDALHLHEVLAKMLAAVEDTTMQRAIITLLQAETYHREEWAKVMPSPDNRR